MRGLAVIAGLIALIMLVTPPIAQATGDLPSAVMLELMVFITVASFLAGRPIRGG